jgi:amino acid efflux transporter
MTGTSAPAKAVGRLSVAQGTALYVGAVLGTGIIALPALAAGIAGPASLVAWLALALLSAPLAATFAALGSRYPDAGGVATYARLAFGESAAAVVGWCFYFSIPLGAPAAALWAGAYVASALGGGTATVAVTSIALMILVPLANAFGARLTGRVQFAFGVLLVAFLIAAIALSLPSAKLSNLTPFAPHGWFAIGPAAALLVWSFVGWEAVTYLTAEFRRPARDVPRATAAAVVIVGVMYLAVAFATITVLGPDAGRTATPLGDLLAVGLGGHARILAAGTALLLTIGTMNAYYAGASKLGAALGRDGALPAWLAKGSVAGGIPRRSLVVVGSMSMVAQLVVLATGVGPTPLILLTTGLFVTVYAIGVAAALRLLPKHSRARAAALVALPIVVILLVMSGVYLSWALLVTGGALIYVRRRIVRSSGITPSV